MSESWRPCSVCKEPIAPGAVYWVCSVSTCNRKRTALAFCSVDCWEVHLPDANHREAWAVEKRAPTAADTSAPTPGKANPKRRTVRPAGGADAPRSSVQTTEVLVIASRLKAYIKERSGYNTSDRVLEPLSELLREVCDRAVENARKEGRMTVLDRDVPKDH